MKISPLGHKERIDVQFFQRLIALVVALSTWVIAVLLCVSSSTIGKIAGWLFLGGKIWMLTVTFIGWLRCPALAKRLFLGRYKFDDTSLLHGFVQAFLRFVWELPQMLLGYTVAMMRIIAHQVDRVEYIHGITYAIDEGRKDFSNMGMSLGNVVNMWLSDSLMHDFEHEVRFSFGQIMMHEFGHTIDSLRLGPLYLIVVGIPSYLSVWLEQWLVGSYRHRDLYAERWANKHAQRYFGIHIRDLD